MFNKLNAVFLSSSLFAMMLTACGGGDTNNGTSDSDTASLNQTALGITTENSNVVGKVVIGSTVGDTGGAAALVSSLIGVQGQQMEHRHNIVYTARHLLDFAVSASKQLDQQLLGVEKVHNCDFAGSFNSDFVDNNANAVLDKGDSLSMAFNNCQDTQEDEVLSGSVRLSLNDKLVATNSSVAYADVELTFNQLRTGVSVINGDMSLILSMVNNDLTTRISGSEISYRDDSGSLAALYDYSMAMTLAGESGGYGMELSGRLASNLLSGSVSFANSQNKPMIGNMLNEPNNLTTGEIIIMGANNSSVRLTPLSNQSVIVETDVDGDGVYEHIETQSWDDVLA